MLNISRLFFISLVTCSIFMCSAYGDSIATKRLSDEPWSNYEYLETLGNNPQNFSLSNPRRANCIIEYNTDKNPQFADLVSFEDLADNLDSDSLLSYRLSATNTNSMIPHYKPRYEALQEYPGLDKDSKLTFNETSEILKKGNIRCFHSTSCFISSIGETRTYGGLRFIVQAMPYTNGFGFDRQMSPPFANQSDVERFIHFLFEKKICHEININE